MVQPIQIQHETVYVNFVDIIDDVRARALMEITTNIIQQLNPKTLYFSFASPGGSVSAGIALYSYLRSLPVKIVMHNIGSVDSIATAIFMAGETRYACPHATFLFHGVATTFNAHATLTSSQLREILSGLEQDENKIAQIITARSKIQEEEIRQLFRQGEAKPPSFALDRKAIHEIRDFVIPPGAPIVSINVK